MVVMFPARPRGRQHFISFNEDSRTDAFCRLDQPDIVISGIRGRILEGFAACQSPRAPF